MAERGLTIRGVRAVPIAVPLKRTFAGSGYRIAVRATVVTRLEVEGGIATEIYNGDNRSHGAEVARIVNDELAPLILGEDAFAIERLWERMARIALPHRDRALARQAIACVDCALWDAIGRALGTSVRRLLGGYRERIGVIAIGGYYEPGKTLDDLAAEMAALRRFGVAGCKVKVGALAPEADAERMAAARQGGGADFVLAADANQGWSVEQAIRFADQVAPLGLAWFEEPCHWMDDAMAMARVRRATRIPVCAGQSEISAAGVRRLIAADAVDLVNLDASECGGVTEWRRAAAATQVAGLKMAHHEEPHLACQMLAAVPHGLYAECFEPARDPIWTGMLLNRPPLEAGTMAVPDEPGFGLHLDWDMVERHRMDRS